MDSLKKLSEKLELLREYSEIVEFLKNDPEGLRILNETKKKINSLFEHIESLGSLLDEWKDVYNQTQAQEKKLQYVFEYIEYLENNANVQSPNKITNENDVVPNTVNNGTNRYISPDIKFFSSSSNKKITPYEDLSPRISPTVLAPKLLTFDMVPMEYHEYKVLPKYMVGRITFDEINRFINLMNDVVIKKYNIVTKLRSQLKSQEVALYNKYKKQEQILKIKGKHFITEEDIAVENGKAVLEKKAYTYLTILRHVKKIERCTINGVTIYIIHT